jgi:hypothetical protein
MYLFSQAGNCSPILRLTIHKVGDLSPKGRFLSLLIGKFLGDLYYRLFSKSFILSKFAKNTMGISVCICLVSVDFTNCRAVIVLIYFILYR